MLLDQRIEDAAEHLQKAEGSLVEVGEGGTHFLSSAREHLAAAITEIEHARETRRPPLPQARRQAITDLASGVMGMLSFLLRQMNETARELEPLGPSRGTDALSRLRREDLRSITSSLGDLRRLTSRLETELRLLGDRLQQQD